MSLFVERASRSVIACARTEAGRFVGQVFLALLVSLPVASWALLRAQEDEPDASGKYHFLAPEDTLGILEEEGKIKGYVDVYQGEEESDAVLSYPITIGYRQGNHLEFKTGKIHQKYYRFSGSVQRGQGHKESDPDYLRLVGDLKIITVKTDLGEEVTERRHVLFKSLGKSEKGETEPR